MRTLLALQSFVRNMSFEKLSCNEEVSSLIKEEFLYGC